MKVRSNRYAKLQKVSPLLAALVSDIAAAYGCNPVDLLSDGRTRQIAKAKVTLYYLARCHTNYSLTELQAYFYRHQATISTCASRVAERMDSFKPFFDPRFAATVTALGVNLLERARKDPSHEIFLRRDSSSGRGGTRK